MPDDTASKLSVQERPAGADTSGAFWLGIVSPQGDVLPAWGDFSREWALRQLKWAAVDTIVGSAFAGFIQRIQATPWEIKGGRNLSTRFQRLFQNAQFGAGWDVFMPRLLDDYLNQDKGAFIEIIGRGDPAKPIVGPVEGIAHLDSLRCVLTGNDEFPVIYQAGRSGKLYKLHRTRVAHIVANPDAHEDGFNLGHSALSRVATVSTLQRLIGGYQRERLSDLPPAGFVTISGMNETQYQQALALYNAGRTQEANNIWRNVMRLMGIDPEKPVKVEFVPFATLPEHFNYKEFVELHVNMIALALGLDVQEIWQLGGGQLGSGAQSQVLAEKSRGKGYGHLLQMLERIFNIAILPEALEFKFKFQDAEQEKAVADRAQVWVAIASNAPLEPMEKRQLLANQVEAFADILLDANGQVKLPDVDRKPADEDTTVDDQSTPGTQPDTTVADDTPAAGRPVQRDRRWRRDLHRFKAIGASRLDFEGDLEDLLSGAVAGDVTRGRAGIVLRALINRYGRQVFEDGLADGGVEDGASDEDLQVIKDLAAAQSAYVTGMLDTLYKDGLTEAEIAGKPALWWQGSMLPFYQAGLMSANANGLYEFGGLDGEETCKDCLRLKGQKHRLKDWVDRNLFPKVGMATECGGWQCEHRLERTTGRAKGSW